MEYLFQGETVVRIKSSVPVDTDDLGGMLNLDIFSVDEYLIIPKERNFNSKLFECLSFCGADRNYEILELPDDDSAILWFNMNYK